MVVNMQYAQNKLGMSVLSSHPEQMPIEEQIALFADTGFDSVFLSCGVTKEFEKIPFWAMTARQHDVVLEAVHNPISIVDSVWLGQEGAEQYEENTKKILDFCSQAEVSKLVIHVGRSADVAVSETGLAFWRKLELYAKQRGVQLCYENSGTPALLAAVVENADAFHGVCHDIGHQLCCTPEIHYEKLYGDRILYTHLHDNFGANRDSHLLPQDGMVDWNTYFHALKNANYRGTLNLELSCLYSATYREMPFPEFVRLAHTRIRTLRGLMDE